MPKHHTLMESVNLTPKISPMPPLEIGGGGGGTTESINKTIIAYDIVKAAGKGFPRGLISVVNLKINQGWSPLGGLMYDGGTEWVWQVIVKYD